MKRAALLVLLVGAPLLLVIFPGLRRALFRKARLVLLLYVGALLLSGLAVGFWSDRASTLSGGEAALAAASAALVLTAFVAVLRDALRDRASRD